MHISVSLCVQITLHVYNYFDKFVRSVVIRLNSKEAKGGIAGITIRFAAIKSINEQTWHCTAVFQGSPAQKAGLSTTDYIVGSPEVCFLF